MEAAAAERLLLLEALSRTVPEELQAHLAEILLLSLLDQSVEVRLLALRHLAPMGPDSPRVRGVADRLRDKQPAVKELAAEVLQTWNREPRCQPRAYNSRGDKYMLEAELMEFTT